MDDNTDRVELSSECEIAESDHDPVADNFHTDLSAAETSRIIALGARDDTAGSDKEADSTEYEPAPATTNATLADRKADNAPDFLRTGIPERPTSAARVTSLPAVVQTPLSVPLDEFGLPFGGIEYFTDH